MKSFVVGFAFDKGKQHVLLIKKNRPEWQMGRYNGIGGHIENGESPIDAMIREFQEETGYLTSEFRWRPLLKIIDKSPLHPGEVFFFFTELDIESCRSITDEQLVIFPTAMLDAIDTVENLQWLIPMGMDEDFKETFTIG